MADADSISGAEAAYAPADIFNAVVARMRLKQERRRVAVTAAVAAFLLAFLAWIRPARFESTLIVTPAASSTASKTAAVASQFGISLGSPDASRTPQFYAQLVLTDEVLLSVARKPVSHDSTQVMSLLASGDTGVVAAAKATRFLQDELYVRADLEAGTLTVKLTSGDAKLSAAVVSGVLEQILFFDSSRRQSRSKLEREYLEKRFDEATKTLADRDSAVARFLLRNRSVSQSPSLQIVGERLQFERQAAAALVSLLEQNLQQARLDEVRDTPAITVVQAPQEAMVEQPRRLPVFFGLGAAFGAVLGVCLVLWRPLDTQAELGR